MIHLGTPKHHTLRILGTVEGGRGGREKEGGRGREGGRDDTVNYTNN